MVYNPDVIEKKWQSYWQENDTFAVDVDHQKEKFYALDMFPYPSGDGLHVGHPEGYTATDIMCRYKRMRGFNVLHPMGWDAYGLPAERYAMRTGVHPSITTQKNINTFRKQIKRLVVRSKQMSPFAANSLSFVSNVKTTSKVLFSSGF